MTVDLADLLTVEQLRVLAEKHGFALVAKQPPKLRPEPAEPITMAHVAQSAEIVAAAEQPAPSVPEQPPAMSMKAGVVKPKGICRLAECENPWMPKTKPGRPPEYCSEAHKKLNKMRSDQARRGTPKPSRASSPKASPKTGQVPATTPATFAKTSVLQEIIPESRRKCGRCDSPDHSVFDCPVPLRSKRERKAAKTQARKPSAVTLVPNERGFAVTNIDVRTPDERRKDREELEQPLVRVDGDGSALSDNEIASTGAQLAQLWTKTGLPRSVGFSYLPDVLALYGLDQDMVESCLRQPDRVEVRPESFHATKRYVVLGFHKADVNVILGMRDQHHPCVIAVYVTAMLENDYHRVDYSGGGGSKKQSGPPKTHTQVAGRLRGLGCDVQVARDHKTAAVTYKGQELGSISYTPTTSRQQADSDWNRMQRKVHGINQQEAASA